MKKLVYVAQTGLEEGQEIEDISVSSWVVGIFDNDADVEKAVNEEIEAYINGELESRFDIDDDMSEEDIAEIEEYRDCFEVYTTNEDNYKLNKAEVYKYMHFIRDYCVQDVKFYVVLIEE